MEPVSQVFILNLELVVVLQSALMFFSELELILP